MTQPEVLETTVLEELKALMEEDFDDLLNDYLQQCDELWREACANLAADDMALLRRSAHTFKGSCLSMGAEALMEQMRALEAAAAAGQREAAADILAAAESEVERVVAALATWRSA